MRVRGLWCCSRALSLGPSTKDKETVLKSIGFREGVTGTGLNSQPSPVFVTYSVGEGGFGLLCFVHRGELPAECVLRALCVVRALRGLVREDREEDAVARVAKSASFVAASRVQEPRFSTF